MTRKETLRMVVNHAQCNGFDFPRWFQMHLRPEWPGAEVALHLLSMENRHYTLLFSHEFVRRFWQSGSKMSFLVPPMTYTRLGSDGEPVEVSRKPFIRRTTKPDVWKYHLSQMAVADDPLKYISKFLPAQQLAGVREIPADRDSVPGNMTGVTQLKVVAR